MKSELSSKNSFASSTTKSSRRTRTEIVKTVSSTSFSSSSSSSSNSSTTSIECYDSGYETTTTTKTTAAAVKCEQVVKNKELTTLQDARLAQSHHGEAESWIRLRERTNWSDNSKCAQQIMRHLSAIPDVSLQKSLCLTLLQPHILTQLWARPRELFALNPNGDEDEKPNSHSQPRGEFSVRNSTNASSAFNDEIQFWKRLREKLSKLNPETTTDVSTLPKLEFSAESIRINPPFAGLLPEGFAAAEGVLDIWKQIEDIFQELESNKENANSTTQSDFSVANLLETTYNMLIGAAKTDSITWESILDNVVKISTGSTSEKRQTREEIFGTMNGKVRNEAILALASFAFVKWFDIDHDAIPSIVMLYAKLIEQQRILDFEDKGSFDYIISLMETQGMGMEQSMASWSRLREMNIAPKDSTLTSKQKSAADNNIDKSKTSKEPIKAIGLEQKCNEDYLRPREIFSAEFSECFMESCGKNGGENFVADFINCIQLAKALDRDLNSELKWTQVELKERQAFLKENQSKVSKSKKINTGQKSVSDECITRIKVSVNNLFGFGQEKHLEMGETNEIDENEPKAKVKKVQTDSDVQSRSSEFSEQRGKWVQQISLAIGKFASIEWHKIDPELIPALVLFYVRLVEHKKLLDSNLKPEQFVTTMAVLESLVNESEQCLSTWMRLRETDTGSKPKSKANKSELSNHEKLSRSDIGNEPILAKAGDATPQNYMRTREIFAAKFTECFLEYRGKIDEANVVPDVISCIQLARALSRDLDEEILWTQIEEKERNSFLKENQSRVKHPENVSIDKETVASECKLRIKTSIETLFGAGIEKEIDLHETNDIDDKCERKSNTISKTRVDVQHRSKVDFKQKSKWSHHIALAIAKFASIDWHKVDPESIPALVLFYARLVEQKKMLDKSLSPEEYTTNKVILESLVKESEQCLSTWIRLREMNATSKTTHTAEKSDIGRHSKISKEPKTTVPVIAAGSEKMPQNYIRTREIFPAEISEGILESCCKNGGENFIADFAGCIQLARALDRNLGDDYEWKEIEEKNQKALLKENGSKLALSKKIKSDQTSVSTECILRIKSSISTLFGFGCEKQIDMRETKNISENDRRAKGKKVKARADIYSRNKEICNQKGKLSQEMAQAIAQFASIEWHKVDPGLIPALVLFYAKLVEHQRLLGKSVGSEKYWESKVVSESLVKESEQILSSWMRLREMTGPAKLSSKAEGRKISEHEKVSKKNIKAESVSAVGSEQQPESYTRTREFFSEVFARCVNESPDSNFEAFIAESLNKTKMGKALTADLSETFQLIMTENLNEESRVPEEKMNADYQSRSENFGEKQPKLDQKKVLAMASFAFVKWMSLDASQALPAVLMFYAQLIKHDSLLPENKKALKFLITKIVSDGCASNSDEQTWIRTREMGLENREKSKITDQPSSVSEKLSHKQVSKSSIIGFGLESPLSEFTRPREMLSAIFEETMQQPCTPVRSTFLASVAKLNKLARAAEMNIDLEKTWINSKDMNRNELLGDILRGKKLQKIDIMRDQSIKMSDLKLFKNFILARAAEMNFNIDENWIDANFAVKPIANRGNDCKKLQKFDIAKDNSLAISDIKELKNSILARNDLGIVKLQESQNKEFRVFNTKANKLSVNKTCTLEAVKSFDRGLAFGKNELLSLFEAKDLSQKARNGLKPFESLLGDDCSLTAEREISRILARAMDETLNLQESENYVNKKVSNSQTEKAREFSADENCIHSGKKCQKDVLASGIVESLKLISLDDEVKIGKTNGVLASSGLWSKEEYESSDESLLNLFLALGKETNGIKYDSAEEYDIEVMDEGVVPQKLQLVSSERSRRVKPATVGTEARSKVTLRLIEVPQVIGKGNSDASLSDNFKVSTIELEGDNDLLEVQLDFDKFCPYMEEGASSSTSLQESQKPEASENLVEITLNGGVLAVRDMTLQRFERGVAQLPLSMSGTQKIPEDEMVNEDPDMDLIRLVTKLIATTCMGSQFDSLSADEDVSECTKIDSSPESFSEDFLGSVEKVERYEASESQQNVSEHLTTADDLSHMILVGKAEDVSDNEDDKTEDDESDSILGSDPEIDEFVEPKEKKILENPTRSGFEPLPEEDEHVGKTDNFSDYQNSEPDSEIESDPEIDEVVDKKEKKVLENPTWSGFEPVSDNETDEIVGKKEKKIVEKAPWGRFEPFTAGGDDEHFQEAVPLAESFLVNCGVEREDEVITRSDIPQAIFQVRAEVPVAFDQKNNQFIYDIVSRSFKVDPAVINNMQIKVTRSADIHRQEQEPQADPAIINNMKIKVTRGASLHQNSENMSGSMSEKQSRNFSEKVSEEREIVYRPLKEKVMKDKDAAAINNMTVKVTRTTDVHQESSYVSEMLSGSGERDYMDHLSYIVPPTAKMNICVSRRHHETKQVTSDDLNLGSDQVGFGTFQVGSQQHETKQMKTMSHQFATGGCDYLKVDSDQVGIRMSKNAVQKKAMLANFEHDSIEM